MIMCKQSMAHAMGALLGQANLHALHCIGGASRNVALLHNREQGQACSHHLCTCG